MEREDLLAVSRPSRKRKLEQEEEGVLSFSMDELNQDLLERALSWLPTSSFFRLSSVCKRWKSVTNSASFKLACSDVPFRDPWFFMVDSRFKQPTIFDSAERCWKKLNHLSFLHQKDSNHDSMPVAASGSLICLRNELGKFTVCNPVTGSYLMIPPPYSAGENYSLQAVAMSTSNNYHSHKIVLVSGELPQLSYKVYDSTLNCWKGEVLLKREEDRNSQESNSNEDGENILYFLSKTGDVVVTNMEKSPSKEYSSVMTCKNGEEMVYFLNCSGSVMACNLTRKCFTEYPRLLPVNLEYSIDVIECRGEMLVVVLSELFESASVRVWKFDKNMQSWQQVAAMPPAMAQEYYGKRVDINCVGAGSQIFMCLNSPEFYSYVMCDLLTNEWTELPNRFANGEAVEFMSAFSVEPRIEVCV